MRITLCTIGFAGKSAEVFFRLLTGAGVQKVIDVRENRGGQLSGYAKHPDIEFFLRTVAGIAYVHELRLAPSPEIRAAYRATRDWSQYEPAFLALMRDRNIPGSLDPREFSGAVALLCSEAGPEKCHRRLVAELCAERWRAQGHTVEIRHLVSVRPKKKSRKARRALDDRTDLE
ncbi:MAG: DUF488 family protein [Candidatus Acidiferrales bacterium]